MKRCEKGMRVRWGERRGEVVVKRVRGGDREEE